MALTKIGSIGINTGIQFAGVTTIATLNASDNVLSVGGTVNFVSDVSIGGTVSIAGTLTYEDVTNIDAVGLITARNGIVVGSGITLSKDGDIFATGISTFSEGIAGDLLIDDKIVHRGDTDTAIRFPAADTIAFETNGTERARIASGGLGIGTPTSDYRLHAYHPTTNTIAKFESGDAGGGILISDPTCDTRLEQTGAAFKIDVDANAETTGETMSFQLGQSEKLKITSDSKIGINASSPDCTLHVVKASAGTMSADTNAVLAIENDNHCVFNMMSPADKSSYIMMGDPDDQNAGQIRYDNNINNLLIEVNGGEKLRINSGGHIGFNVTPGSWDSPPTFIALEGGGNSKHGSLHFQANGDWTTSLGCNNYYNGGWKYRHNGGASWLAIKEDELKFNLASSGSADGAVSWSEKFIIDSVGNIRIPQDNAQLLIGASGDLQIYHDTTGTAGTVIKNTTGHLYVQSIGDVKLRTVDSEIAVDCQANGAVHLHYDGASDSSFYTRADGFTVRNNNVESGKDCNVDMIGRVNGNAQLHLYADDNTDNNKKFQIKASNSETMDFNSYYTGGWDFHLRFSKGANNTSDRKVQVGKGGLRFDLGAEDYRDIDGDGHLFRRDGQAQLGVDDFFYIHDINTSENNVRLRIRFETNAGKIDAESTIQGNQNLDFAEYFEWSDGNPSNEDRIGHTVSADGLTGKIKIAEEGETVIGVISGTACFVGGGQAFSWQGRFKHDEWGREVFEQLKDENGNLIYADAETRSQIVKTERIETEEYDPSLENSYVPRELRKEWDIVGLVGQIRVRKTAVIPSNWVKLKEIDSVKDLYLVK